MNPTRARLAALLASMLFATLGSRGIRGLTPELETAVASWLSHTLELLILVGYAALDGWLRSRAGATAASPGERGAPAPEAR